MDGTAALRVPVQSRSHKTRAALLGAAKEAFSRRGYAETTAKSIAERAGVGTGTFYHYFPDKDAALREICTERVEYLFAESAKIAGARPGTDGAHSTNDAERRLTKLVELYVAYHREDRGLHAVIGERRLCDPGIDAILSRSERHAVERFSTALERWGHDGDRDAAAFMMFSLLEGAVHGHVLSTPILSESRFVSSLVQALVRLGASGKTTIPGAEPRPPKRKKS